MNDSSAMLKSLNTQIESTKKEILATTEARVTLKSQDDFLVQKLRAFESSIAAARSEIEKLKKSEKKRDKLLVSEHCLLRYLERVKGLDIDGLKEEILVHEVTSSYNSFGDGKYPHPSGGRVIVKDGMVITFEN